MGEEGCSEKSPFQLAGSIRDADNHAMKVQRVYVDTSVLGGGFDEEFAPWSNGLMRDFRRGNFEAATSDVVAAEVEPAPDEVQSKYAELESYGATVVEVTEDVVELADAYERRGILSSNHRDDGLHIAAATVHAVDVLTSWNFQHIVHIEKIRRFNTVNQEPGYKPIDIRSPREVTTHGPGEKDV
ncbi:MAG: hypothetical protein BRD43_04030 [Bacteroidetes bacterium QS_4_64_154]|nr:MAG: hypothetical protein BRD43_04030 [Bacteroidetes bacterium QS_4_64_154]